ncbi:hypothetical protein LQW54_004910 [Pestalotiopsis sp. IQ-011]
MAFETTFKQMDSASIFLIVLAGIAIAIRFGVALKTTSRVYADDGNTLMTVVALSLLIGAIVTNDVGVQAAKKMAESPPTSDPTPFLDVIYQVRPPPNSRDGAQNYVADYEKMAVGSAITSGLVGWAAKAPIPLLLIRLFGIKRWLRFTAIVTLTISGVVTFVATGWSAASCDSHGTFTPEFVAKCNRDGCIGGVINGCISLALDLTCFVMPLVVVQNLHLPLKQKLGLLLVFSTGVIVIAAGAVGLYFKVRSLLGVSIGDFGTSATILMIECSVAIIVSCAPATYTFWNKYITRTTLYSRFRSAVSRISLVSNRRTTYAQSSRGDGANSGRSSNLGDDLTYVGMAVLPKKSNDTNQASEV